MGAGAHEPSAPRDPASPSNSRPFQTTLFRCVGAVGWASAVRGVVCGARRWVVVPLHRAVSSRRWVPGAAEESRLEHVRLECGPSEAGRGELRGGGHQSLVYAVTVRGRTGPGRRAVWFALADRAPIRRPHQSLGLLSRREVTPARPAQRRGRAQLLERSVQEVARRSGASRWSAWVALGEERAPESLFTAK